MRKATGLLALCGAALVAGVTASADTPTTILDTYGDGSRWGIGATKTAGAGVGYDANNGNGTNVVPSDPTKAAYAVLPFSVTALPAGQSVLSGVDIVFNAQTGAATSSNLNSLTGAIFEAPTGATTLNSEGVVQIGTNFAFDTSVSRDMIFVQLGSGLSQLVSATGLSTANITLQAGKSYFLVIEPKAGLNPTGSDTLVDFGLWNARSNADITASGAVLSNSYTTVGQAQDTYLPTNPGDASTLQPVKIGTRTPVPGYFGARLSVSAPAAATVNGRLALEAVPDLSLISPGAPLGMFTFDFRTPGTTNVVFTAQASLTPIPGTPYGSYSVSGVPVGTYDVAIKGTKNLRVALPSVTVTGATTLADVTLPAGDADNNNSVDISDFGALINAFSGVYTLPGTGYDPAADFNFDGSDDIGDFGILVNEYSNVGA